MAQENTSDLIGKFFHSFTDEGIVHWQGYVLERPEPGMYLVQLFEWIMGEPSSQKLVPADDMKGWSFYDTNEEMNETYYRKYLAQTQDYAEKKMQRTKGDA